MKVTRNTRSRNVVADSTHVYLDAAVESKNVRVSRNSKNKKNAVEICDNGDMEGVEEVKKNVRVTRNSKNKNTVEVCDSSNGDLEGVKEKVEEVKKNVRVTRNLRNKMNKMGTSELSVGDFDGVKEPRNVRMTRNMKNKGVVIGEDLSLGDGVENVENKKTRGGAKGKRKLREEIVGDGDGKENCHDAQETEKLEEECVGDGDGNKKDKLPEEHVGDGEDKEKNKLTEEHVDDREDKKKKEKLQEECVAGEEDKEKEKSQEECVGDGDGKENCNVNEKENLIGDENWPDLEKISLGEWFDFLEVCLTKQIHDETKEIIDSMRQKAEGLREYVIIYQNQQAGTATEC